MGAIIKYWNTETVTEIIFLEIVMNTIPAREEYIPERKFFAIMEYIWSIELYLQYSSH